MAENLDGNGGGNGRQSNNDLLRDLQSTTRDVGRQVNDLSLALAGMTPQLSALVKIGEQTQAQIQNIVQRAESTDRNLIVMKGRMEILEARPVSMSPEEQGDMRATMREHGGNIRELISHNHDLANAVQQLKTASPPFSYDEQIEIKRMLKLIAKYEVDDLFSRDEVDGLKQVCKDRSAGRDHRAGRKVTLENSLIGIIISGAAFGFILPFLEKLVASGHP